MSPVVKRPKEKFVLPSKYVLLILTVICVALMIVAFAIDFEPKVMNTAVGYVVRPLQSGLSYVSEWTNDKVTQFKELRNVMEENELLKEQVQQLTTENIRLQQDEYELETLRSLLELKNDYSDYEMVGARVIAKDPGNYYSAFVIDKGTNDGLESDMNVLAEGGLVGRITEVGPNWARVTTIIEDDSNVSGMVLSTEDHLIVSGNLEAYLEGRILFSQLVDDGNRVSVGDKIVTSNISDKYLPGILIGYVTQVYVDSNNLTKSGYLVPYVDFEHLSVVTVITTKKQTVD